MGAAGNSNADLQTKQRLYPRVESGGDEETPELRVLDQYRAWMIEFDKPACTAGQGRENTAHLHAKVLWSENTLKHRDDA